VDDIGQEVFLLAKLILLRHGESEWNSKNLFTGWVDVDLNEKGEGEARHAADPTIVCLGNSIRVPYPICGIAVVMSLGS
jgi:hypothetical protein